MTTQSENNEFQSSDKGWRDLSKEQQDKIRKELSHVDTGTILKSPLLQRLGILLDDIDLIAASFGKDREGLIKFIEEKYDTEITFIKWDDENNKFNVTILAPELIRICQGQKKSDSFLSNRGVGWRMFSH